MVVQQRAMAISAPPIVLIVEDDRDTRELYETVFELEGFWVTNALSADAAIDQVELLQPDVIITDVGLPGGCDGEKLARRVHQIAKTAGVPVIAVTGRALSELSPKAEFVEILQKPIYPNELVATTRRVLAASAALRERSETVRVRIPPFRRHSDRLLSNSKEPLGRTGDGNDSDE